MKKIGLSLTLPETLTVTICDDCEVNEATMVSGYGCIKHEICGNCRLRVVMSKP